LLNIIYSITTPFYDCLAYAEPPSAAEGIPFNSDRIPLIAILNMSDLTANDTPVPSIETKSGSGLENAKNTVVNSKVGYSSSPQHSPYLDG
jgi:hypothetical protein